MKNRSKNHENLERHYNTSRAYVGFFHLFLLLLTLFFVPTESYAGQKNWFNGNITVPKDIKLRQLHLEEIKKLENPKSLRGSLIRKGKIFPKSFDKIKKSTYSTKLKTLSNRKLANRLLEYSYTGDTLDAVGREKLALDIIKELDPVLKDLLHEPEKMWIDFWLKGENVLFERIVLSTIKEERKINPRFTIELSTGKLTINKSFKIKGAEIKIGAINIYRVGALFIGTLYCDANDCIDKANIYLDEIAHMIVMGTKKRRPEQSMKNLDQSAPDQQHGE